MSDPTISQATSEVSTDSVSAEAPAQTTTADNTKSTHSTDPSIGSQIAEQLTKADEVALPELTPQQIEKLLTTIKRKVKVDGAELEVPLAELETDYQLKAASHKKLREAAALRKEAEAAVAKLKADPRRALRELGVDVRKLSEDELSEALAEEMMSPAEKALRDREKAIAEREARIEAAEAERKEAEIAAQVPVLFEQYERGVKDALRGAGLPETPQLMRAVAAQVEDDLKAGLELNFSAAASVVAQHFTSYLGDTLKNAGAESLVRLLGEEGLKKLREYDLGRLKAPAPVVPAAAQPPAEERQKAKKSRTLEEIFAEANKRAGID